MLVLRRRVRTWAYRFRTFLIESRWIVLSLLLAAVGAAAVFVDVLTWINISLAFGSLVLVAVEIRQQLLLRDSIGFAPRPSDDYQDVRNALEDSTRYRVFDFPNGIFLHDRVFSTAVDSGPISASLDDVYYILPGEIRSVGKQFLRQRLSEKRHAYNDPVVGMRTDIGTGDLVHQTYVKLMAARYWDHVSSDLFAMFDVTFDGRYEPNYGRSLIVHRSGFPRDFGDSWLLNAVGASVLALTSDARLVVVSQSAANDSSPDLFAPSGSGSVEPKDFRGADELSFKELAINGANRELSEETGIGESEVAESFFLGFGRWLDKAAKPEAFSVAFLSIDSHEVRRRRIPRADRPFTKRVEARRFSLAPANWRSDDALTMVDGELRSKLSVPLAAGLALLATHVEAGTSLLSIAAVELFERGSLP